VFSPFIKLFHEGGWVLFPIFAVSVIVWHIATGKLFRFIKLGKARKRVHAILTGPQAGGEPRTGYEPFDVLVTRLRRPGITPESVERAFDELLIEITPRLERGFSTISACVVMAPLLGLLGTITGMNTMFSVIGRFGFGNPTIMANGISMALQATLTGLSVAVTSLLFLDYLNTSKQKVISGLREDRDIMLSRTLAARPSPASQPEEKKGGSMRNASNPFAEEHQNPEINLAPFVDTIMILLIFFVVTANMMVETGVDVSKPKAQSAQPAGQKAILIGITREGTVHVGGRQFTIERLRTLVEQEVSKQPDVSVMIVSDRDGAVGRTVDVIDQCTLAGAQKISIAAHKD
jgi:biopolymer transport protein ExbD